MELLDYTEKSTVVDLHDFYNFHVDTLDVRKGVENRNSNVCPFCLSKLTKVCHFTRHMNPSSVDWGIVKFCTALRGILLPSEYYIDFFTYNCNFCGWWKVEARQDPIDVVDYIFPTLRKFKIDSKNLPLGILWKELLKKPELLHSLDPYVFEKFVGSVMSSLLDVQINHIGKTGDGGVDLFYCQGKVD